MLYLDQPIRVGRLDVFRDYNDSGLFHYLPGSPRIATEAGDPLFHLLVWRGEDDAGEEEGGGFLTMTSDLAVSQAELDRARREVGRRFGVTGARMVPLQVESGAVKVSMLDASSGDEGTGSFVERILAHGTPSLYGDQRAVFKAELSRRGATAMRESLSQEGASPVMLVYELTYRGLIPAYECKIEIEFRQSYEYLRQRSTFSSLWLKTDVDREIEELDRRGAISIEEVVYHDDDPESRQQRLQQLQDLARELAQWTFFKPGLEPGSVLAEGVRDLHAVGGVEAGAGTAAGTPFHRMMTGTGSRPGTPPARPANAGAEASGSRLSGRPAAAAAEGEGQGEGQAEAGPAEGAGEAADRGPSAAEAWDRAGRPQATYQLKELSQEERQKITFELTQVSSVTRTIAPQGQLRMLPGMADAAGRIQEIDLDDPFFRRFEGTVSLETDLERLGVHALEVELRYGTAEDASGPAGDASFELTGAGEEQAFGFFRDAAGSLEIDYRVTVDYDPDAAIGDTSARAASDWITTSERHIAVDPRVAAPITALEVVAATVDWDLVRQVQAQVIYDDPRGDELEGRTTLLLDSQKQSDRVLVRPRSASDPVRVVADFRYADGSVDTVQTERRGSGPVVLNQPPDTTHTVDVTLLDPLARYERATVQFARGAEGAAVDRAVELAGNNARATWSFRPDDPADRSYRYKATYFLAGPVREQPWITTGATQLLLGDRVDGLLQVEVLLLGALEAAGMRALRLRLRYPGAPGWADPDFETTLVAGSPPGEPIRWLAPMQDRRATGYTVERFEWFRQDGGRLAVGPVETAAETLLIDPANPEVVL